MKRGITKAAITTCAGLFCLLVTLPSVADAVEDQGTRMVNCFHPGDRHMETSCDKLLTAAQQKAKEDACDGTAAKAAACDTSYRGRRTNTLFRMHTEMSIKYTCDQNKDGSRTRRTSAKFLNTRDEWTPEPCELETWRVIETKEIKAAPQRPSKAKCAAMCSQCMAAPEDIPDTHFMCGLAFDDCCTKAGGSAVVATCQCN